LNGLVSVLQKPFNEYSKNWYNLRACITDLGGKEYYSKLIFRKPTWGEGKINVWSAGHAHFTPR